MDWSGTSRIPDGDRVDPLPPELRADLGRPYDPQQHEGDHIANWIVWVAIVICLAVPVIAAIWAIIDSPSQ